MVINASLSIKSGKLKVKIVLIIRISGMKILEVTDRESLACNALYSVDLTMVVP